MAVERTCADCGVKVYEVPSHFSGTFIVDKGKVEIVTLVRQCSTYVTQAGWKIHKCVKKV